MRKLLALLVLLGLFAGGLYVAGGYMDGPTVEIVSPERFVGSSSSLDVIITAPGGDLSSLQIEFEQDDERTVLLRPDDPVPGADDEGRVQVTSKLGREAIPAIHSGPARVVVSAAHPVLRGVRTVETVATRDVMVHLERPRLAVFSTHHYVNQGGAEMVVYRVSAGGDAEGIDVESGAVVDGIEYPGYPVAGVDIEGMGFADPDLRVAFFALLHDQPADASIMLYARDSAGNATTLAFDHRIFPKTFRSSRIQLDDRFLERVVPAILATTTEVAPEGALIDQYVVVNSDLRRLNAETIASFASETAPELLWRGEVFHPFTNNAVESAFADRRTYLYEGREVDRQVHLGFDLASVAHAPIVAANRGRVLFADELGIYGNAVIIDHGMGIQSLYAHLSALEVEPGMMVDKGQRLGLSGMTGLAGGDHLHFTMLVNGQMVNPVEWWDAHWIEDRILRKLRPGA